MYTHRSLSGVIVLQKDCDKISNITAFLTPGDLNNMYRSYKQALPPVDTFSQGLYFEIKAAIDEFMEEKDEDELSIKLFNMCKRAMIYEARAIRCIAYLLPELTPQETTKTSEANVITSYIHPVIRSMFKDKFRRCYNANQNVLFDNLRPDYKVDNYDSYYTNVHTTVFGEIKPKQQSSNDLLLTIDFYRLALFLKDTIDQNNLEASVVFQAIGNNITFYLMKLDFEKTHVLAEIATIELPTTLEKLPTMLIALDPIIKVCMLYESLCRVTADVNYHQLKHPSLPMYQLEGILNKTRNKRRRTLINFHK